jgi:predicted transcriptional regulator
MTIITLPDDIEAWAKDAVLAGHAPSVEAFIETALRQQRDLLDRHKALVEEGYAALDRGEALDEAEMDAELDRWIAEDLAAGR